MQIITRAQAGLPPIPSRVAYQNITDVIGITGHHTGGTFSSWYAIWHWMVLGRPESQRLIDVGYNFGIAKGQITELRGWNRRGAHDHDNRRLGVVFGGNYANGLPSAADLAAFVWLVQEARRRSGKQLVVTPHRDVWSAGHQYDTDCPGTPTARWMTSTLPGLLGATPTGDDMAITDADAQKIVKALLGAKLGSSGPTTAVALQDGYRLSKDAAVATSKLETTLAALVAAPLGVDVEHLTALIRREHETAAERERAERAAERGQLVAEMVAALPSGEPLTVDVVTAALTRVLGSVDGATPAD